MLHYNNLLLQFTNISIMKEKPTKTQTFQKKNNKIINVKILIRDINQMSLALQQFQVIQ